MFQNAVTGFASKMTSKEQMASAFLLISGIFLGASLVLMLLSLKSFCHL